jgi:pimeloyl-ACP methyl ester carboxylesterase
MNAQPNIVLVHGAWADGSCWSDVIAQLQARGYIVTAPQFPESSLADDVARLRQVLSLQAGPTLVVGHSYGGQIMTALGEDTSSVVGLVYIAAFGLDQGESIGALLQAGPPTPALAHLNIDSRGFAWLPEEDYVGHFAADIDPAKAKVMYAVQQALSVSTLEDVMGIPAWKALPTWYLVASEDQAIPPDAERAFAKRMGATTVEIASNHCAMVSHPGDVVSLIETAAQSVAAG